MEAVLSSKIAPNKGDSSRRLLRLNAMVVHRISASDTLSTDTTRDSENQNRNTQVTHICASSKGGNSTPVEPPRRFTQSRLTNTFHFLHPQSVLRFRNM